MTNERDPTRPVRRELRIAPVMTGGTSLSVWMGGVTAELYCLLASGTQGQTAPSEHDREPKTVELYRALLELTQFEPRVDVITGTSAGGLNGTLLAAAWRCWLPPDEFVKLRETWLNLADLKELLRSPNESEPPSLLRGDAYFRVEIEKVLTNWSGRAEGWKKDAAEQWKKKAAKRGQQVGLADLPDHPLDLLITVTTVDAEARSRRDDYGETISDVNHAHRLRFCTADISEKRQDWPTKLAVASRTSACIPGVFEPSFIPTNEVDAKKADLPNFAAHASFQQSHYAVDGGVVVNLPLSEALERVFFQPAEAPVRRVVFFVQPTPSLTPRAARASVVPPTLRESVGTLFTAPRAEGLTEQVDRIREHNRSVGRQASVRRSLFDVLGADLEARAQVLMDTYRDQRTSSSVHNTAGYIAKALDGRLLDRNAIEEELKERRLQLVPKTVAATGTKAKPEEWAWGIAPVEHAGSMVLGLIRSAPPDVGPRLAEQFKLTSDALGEVRKIRELDRDHWTEQLKTLNELVKGLDNDEIPGVVATWASTAYSEWPNDQRAATLQRLEEAFTKIVSQLAATAAVLRESRQTLSDDLSKDLNVLAPSPTPHLGLAMWLRALYVLQTVLPGDVEAREQRVELQRLAVRLRALHVLQTVLLGDVEAREQRVELQIVSWNAKDHLTQRNPDDKLAGPELARLGAFLKRSWRANDWCWGRLDGASRLTDLLLDPTHLRDALTQPGRDADTAIAKFVEAFGFEDGDRVTGLIKQVVVLPAHSDPASAHKQAHAELTGMIAHRLQLAVAREELPKVAEAVRWSIEHERSNELNGAEFLRVHEQANGSTAPEDTVKLLEAMRVGEEGVGSELGYGLLNRTISRGSAIAVNALSSDSAGLAAVSKVLSPLRAPLHTLNAVVSVATSGSPLNRFLSTLAFAIGGALVGLRIVGVEVATPLVVAAGILLAGALAAALLRSGFWRQIFPLFVIATIIGLAVVGDDLDDVLYDTTKQYETTELPAGAVIDLGDAGQVTLTRPSGADDLDEQLALPDGSILVESDGAVVREVDAQQTTDRWKRLWFTHEAIVQWVVVGAAILATIALLRSLRGASKPMSWKSGSTVATIVAIGLLLAGAVTLVITDVFTSASKWALTGQPDGPWPKQKISQSASALGEYRVEVVVLIMMISAVLLGRAYDLVLRRIVRRIRLSFR